MSSITQLIVISSGILTYAMAVAWHNRCIWQIPMYFVGLHIGFLLLLALLIGFDKIVQIWRDDGFFSFLDFAYACYEKHALGLIFSHTF